MFTANIYIHRWIGEWFYYNFAAGSFTQRNFVADFIRLNLNFIQKKTKNNIRFLSHPLGKLAVT